MHETFEVNGHAMGYALVRRYGDDPRLVTPAQISQAASGTVPAVAVAVAPPYWSFRIMVGLGLFFILLTCTFFVLRSGAS